VLPKVSDRFKEIDTQTQYFWVIPLHCILNLKNMKFVIKKIWLKTGCRGEHRGLLSVLIYFHSEILHIKKRNVMYIYLFIHITNASAAV